MTGAGGAWSWSRDLIPANLRAPGDCRAESGEMPELEPGPGVAGGRAMAAVTGEPLSPPHSPERRGNNNNNNISDNNTDKPMAALFHQIEREKKVKTDGQMDLDHTANLFYRSYIF